MTALTDPILTHFEPSHIAAASALSRAENWPHRVEDWALIFSLSKGIVALAEGQVAGTAMATDFGRVGMLNMIIVGATLRGRGLGRKLMESAMDMATPSEWRLVATEDGLPLYRKLGFVETGTIIQQQGILSKVLALDARDLSWAEPDDLGAIAAIDAAATGADRRTLLSALLDGGKVAVLRRQGRIEGYAVMRDFGRGAVAGPVIAEDSDTAKRLFAFIFADRAGSFMRVDSPADKGLEPWLSDLGLFRVGGGIAMSRGATQPQSPDFQRFALAAQALG